MIFLFFIFGLVVGSFLNVVIYRLASEQSGIISGRSHCMNCGHELSWRDNIPIVSYVLLFGKCRYCKSKISLQYPLVEFFTAIIFVVVAYASEISFVNNSILIAIVMCIILASMFVVFIYDFKYMEVPMIAIYIAIALGFLLFYLNNFDFHSILIRLLSAITAFSFFFGLSYFSNEEWMGYGDGYIAFVIGLVLSPFWAFVAILIAVWSGAIIGSILMLIKGKSIKTAIPFGPYLVTGLYLAYFLEHFYPDFLGFMMI